MGNNELMEVINGIKESDINVMQKAKLRVDSLAKPLGSLGKLEDIAVKLSGITGEINNSIHKKCIVVMCSDNGVVEEGVSSTPQIVTLAQTINFTRGLTGVAVLAKENNTDLFVVDVGINCENEIPGAIYRKISKGTKNIRYEAAMGREQCIEAINTGIEMAKRAYDENYDILGVGEMGIGNTTTSSAILVTLTDCKVEEAVGKGAGLTLKAYENKKQVIKEAIKVNKPNKEDVIDVLAKVGGYDLAAMTGVFLGAAYYRKPVVIDGFISAVAALCAFKINPLVRDYLIASHCSEEIGYKIAMSEMELEPMLNLNMRLGEGSGCPIAFSIVQYACAMMNNMATFEEAEINDDYLNEVRGNEYYKV